MLNLNDERIAILLRHNVVAARVMMEHNDPSGYQPIDLRNFPKEKMRLYLAAVKDLKRTADGYYMPHEMWFETHWALFPFTNRWNDLDHDAQRFVEYVHKLCQQMTIVRG